MMTPQKRCMSQGVATIYGGLLDELKFAKQQQWMTTNYLLLVLAAIFGIGKAVGPLTVCEKSIATFLVVVALATDYYVLIDLQRYMGKTRTRLRMNAGFFSLKNTRLPIFGACQFWLC